ncbi:MAG: hypothetical protein JWO46_1889, partial [Nocardioidaceae bacterium]|nr:hypothetical protein [Nocardioidaceae bacterium]
MAEPNNAAGQLIYWFEQAREHDPDNNLQLLSVWCDVWNLDSNDPRDRATFMSMAANLSDLAETVRHEVTELDDLFPSAVLLEDFEQVEEALGEFLDTTTGLRAQLGNIRETGWKGLRSLDAFLSRHRPGTVVNREGIAQLLDYVNTLVRAVLSDG